MLRATIVCANGDSYGLALQRVIATFDLREGNGRLKNMLNTTAMMPPRILINCAVRAPGCPPIIAEVQVYLDGIKKIADLQHRYYEIRRATAVSELVAEADLQATRAEAEAPEDAETPEDALEPDPDPKRTEPEPPTSADLPPEAPEPPAASWIALCST